MKRAAVIGAGVAGLQIARRLDGLGMDVRVFEKARGPAGRISTRRSDHGQFDHGAQYFTAREQPFRAQTDDWLRRGVVEKWQPRVVELDRSEIVPERSAPTRYVGVPGMSAITRDMVGALTLETTVRVESVRREGDAWHLVEDDGRSLGHFDFVVSAVPAEQAPPLLEHAPLLASHARGVRMLACFAAMVTFERQPDLDFDAAFVRDSPVQWFASNASKPGRGEQACWVLHANPEWSEANLNRPVEEIGSDLLEGFSRSVACVLPEVEHIGTHRWLLARPAKPLNGSILLDESLRIAVCGDWLQGDRIEDAFMSADRLADEIRDRISDGRLA